MKTNRAMSIMTELFSLAGVRVNGENAWDIRVRDDRFYERTLYNGTMGIGEAYIDAFWDCPRLDEFFTRAIRASLENQVGIEWRLRAKILLSKIFNRQTISRAYTLAQKHYDLDNRLFEAMLDKRMVYTCGYWKDAATLDEAQENKLHLVCRKLNLQPGMHVLDIGCGWGSFAKFAAEKYGVRVTGVTVAKEQVTLAQELCDGLPVQIQLKDYREIKGKYDHVVSLGMFEHVGFKNYRTFFSVAQSCLANEGLLLLQSVGSNSSHTFSDPWIDKYIFPGTMVPSVKQLGDATEGMFIVEDWHSFGADYDKTLMSWYSNFDRKWDTLRDRYDERFYRMWTYYLQICAASFRARENQLWQIVFSKKGVPGGYATVR